MCYNLHKQKNYPAGSTKKSEQLQDFIIYYYNWRLDTFSEEEIFKTEINNSVINTDSSKSFPFINLLPEVNKYSSNLKINSTLILHAEFEL